MDHPEIMTFAYNPTLEGMAELLPDITYSRVDGKELKLCLIEPWRVENDARRFPLIVFIQGSAWTFPNINYEIPQLSQWARKGYVVATVTHRSALDGCAFPAFLQDVKTAIRFLRAHAGQYSIDPDRVCAYGTSSGGNTALLLGVTGDFPEFKTDEYAAYSDSVRCVAECFGPTDMKNLLPDDAPLTKDGDLAIFAGLVGDGNVKDIMRRMSPITYVERDRPYPPFLLLHGDADRLVPYEQGVAMYEKLLSIGADVRMIRVKNAPHEGAFWSQALIDEVFAFIQKHL